MDKALIKKLRLKEGQSFLVINAPKNYLNIHDLDELNIQINEQIYRDNYDVIQIFITQKAHIAENIKVLNSLLSSKTTFWISYPKKNSGIISDLSMTHWDELNAYLIFAVRLAGSRSP